MKKGFYKNMWFGCAIVAGVLIICFLGRHRIAYEYWLHRGSGAESRKQYKEAIVYYEKAVRNAASADTIKHRLATLYAQVGILAEIKAIPDNGPLTYYRKALLLDSLNCRALMGVARLDSVWPEKIRASRLAYSQKSRDIPNSITCYILGKGPGVFKSLAYPTDDYWPTIEKKSMEIQRQYGYSFYTSLMLSVALERRGNFDSADMEFRLAKGCLEYSPIVFAGKSYYSPEDYVDTVFLHFYNTEQAAIASRRK
jgi:hypothetical protein